jgi:RNA polymerase sigma factor (sigma-70 family)
MASRPLIELTHDLGRALLRRDGADLTDAQLLTRFAERRDEAAFEALVRRHAPMVLSVCRRLLRNVHDAEDAFQVVFLVLAQKAVSVRPREAVAGWLYGVARKAALKARAAAARRREHPVAELGDLPEPPPRHDPAEDLWPLLERELSRLPEKYRAVVVLCDLEGRSRRDAARLLGWPEGTVDGRLARARALLARRLRHCGGALVGATLVAADPAPACVPAALLTAVLRLASSPSPHTASAATVLTLARGVRRALWLGKLKLPAAVLAGAGLLGACMGIAWRALYRDPANVQGSIVTESPTTQARVAPADVRTDAQRLRGVWQLVSLINDGNKATEDQVRDVRLELTDTAFRSTCAGDLFRESTYTIDPTRDPSRLDFTNQGDLPPHECQSIYRFDGDQLVLCYPKPNAERPARFESTPGSGLTLTRWRRVGN